MDLINTLVAIMALIGGLLCARAYLPHIELMGKNPSDYLARGLVLSALSIGPRSLYWDVANHLMGDGFTQVQDALGGISINILFNLVLLWGIHSILKARYLSIPEEDRSKYTVFSAVFYPKGLWPRMSRASKK